MNKLLLPFSVLCCLSLPATADDIVIPVGQQAAEKQALERPALGSTQDQVRGRYGDPQEWSDPVGRPPISSWEYKDFVVYFEHNLVLHSVLKRNGN
tara:strand:+ start:15233 stop:15520 length:288 start_codon:yes stop_codon:yes gene_type:complete